MSKITSKYELDTTTLVTSSGDEFEVYLDLPIAVRVRLDESSTEMGEFQKEIEPYADGDDVPEELAVRFNAAQAKFRETVYETLRSRIVPEDLERFDEAPIYEREMYELVGELQRASDEKVSADSGRPTKKSSSPSRSSARKKATRASTES